jgi:hypothetical protein
MGVVNARVFGVVEPVPQREARDRESENRAHLERGAPVLDRGGVTHAANVDGGDRRDHRDGHEVVGERGERGELTRIVRERHRECRRGARVDRQEQRPAEQECRQTAERLTHVDVAAARVGKHGAELAECERAQQGEYAPDDPDDQSHADVPARLAQHRPRHGEDTRTDRGADDDEDEVAERQDAGQLPHRPRHVRARGQWPWPLVRSSPCHRYPAFAPQPQSSASPLPRGRERPPGGPAARTSGRP